MSRLSKPDMFVIVLSVLYVLTPIDFIPEIIAGPLGLTDDMAAIAVIIATVMRARSRVAAAPAPATPNQEWQRAPHHAR